MLRRRLLYGAVLIAALLFQIFYWGWLAQFLLVLALTLPLLSLLLSLPVMLACRVQVEADRPAVSRDEPAGWVLTVEGPRSLPFSRLTLRLSVSNALTGEVGESRCASPVRPPARVSPSRQIPPAAAGWRPPPSGCGCAIIWGCSPFHAPAGPPRCWSFPARSRPGSRPACLPRCTGGSGSRPRPGGGPGEDYELRPYRPGDPLRMVHWKLSSKGEDLVVRETLDGRQASVLFTFDHYGPLAEQESVLEQLRALCQTVLSWNRTCLVRWVHPLDGQTRSFQVSDPDSLLAMLGAALSDPLPVQGRSILELPSRSAAPAVRTSISTLRPKRRMTMRRKPKGAGPPSRRAGGPGPGPMGCADRRSPAAVCPAGDGLRRLFLLRSSGRGASPSGPSVLSAD